MQPENTKASISSIEDGISKFTSEMHSEKALFLIALTEIGIEICFNDSHLLNAYLFIILTDDGTITLSSFAQPLKTDSFMHSKQLGISIFINDEHFSNAESPIKVTVEGISIDCNDVHFLNAEL